MNEYLEFKIVRRLESIKHLYWIISSSLLHHHVIQNSENYIKFDLSDFSECACFLFEESKLMEFFKY